MVKNRFFSLVDSILNFFYKIIYYFIIFNISIGDFIRKLITSIFKILANIFYYFFVYIGLFFSKITIFITKIFKKIFKSIIFSIKFVLKIPKNIFTKTIKFFKNIKFSIPKFSLPKNIFEKKNIKKEKLLQKKVFIKSKFNFEKLEYFFLGIFFTIIFVVIYQGYQFAISLPNPKLIGSINYPVSSQIFDRKGKLLYEIYRDQNRTPVKLDDLPIFIRQATIAIEDKSFYSHNGISVTDGILRAIKEMVLTGRLQGGSTITQQLVKSALLTPERTFSRKIKEIILALWVERIYTKNQILEMYLNHVPYGGSSYGVEEASKNYFNKSSKELTIGEAAFLAGLPQSPTIYSPYTYPDLAKERRNDVLKKMKELGFISEEEFGTEVKKELIVVPPKQSIKAPHFVFYIKSLLEEEYGIHQVEEAGFRVNSSLNLDIQQAVETILKEEIEKIKNLNVTNGAVLVTNPQTGEILAMVGSKDYFENQTGAYNVATALRQPGSSIKPLLYSYAIEKGFYTAASIIDDSPVTYKISSYENYKPVNYDGKFHGKVTLRLALANSFNIPAVKILNTVGVEDFAVFAQKLGISSWNDPSRFGLSLALGGGEVRMTDMAKAFGVLANGGKKTELTPILKINNFKNEEVFDFEKNNSSLDFLKSNQVISPGTAYIISDILSDNNARTMAFGPKSALEIPGVKVAVKTGTTNDKRDNWTIGYTPNFMVTVWVGNNDNTPMNPALTSGITGAAPIWNRVMTYLLKYHSSQNDKYFEETDDLVTKNCYFGKSEYFIKGTETKANCKENLFNVTPTPTP